MSIQLPEYIYVKVFETGEDVKVGSFTIDETTVLKYIRARLWLTGSVSGNITKVRAVISDNSAYNGNVAASEWVKLKDLLNYNRVNFQFADTLLNVGPSYRLHFETENYTRNGDTFYLGAAFDYPETKLTWQNGQINGAGINFAVIGEVAQ